MTFGEKNDFVVDNTTAKYFDKDAELYRKTMSTSRLIPELAKANQFNREELDGRMLMEMLDFVTPEEILKNRGILKKKVKKDSPLEFTGEKADELLKKDPKELDYEKELKPLVKFLNLKTKDNKKKSFIAAVETHIDTLIADEIAREEKAEADRIAAEKVAAEKAEAEKVAAEKAKAEKPTAGEPSAEEKATSPGDQGSPPGGAQETDKKKEEQG